MDQPKTSAGKAFPTGKKELILGLLILCLCLFMVNCILFGGFHLGFAAAYILCTLCSSAYLLSHGSRPGCYSITLLLLSCVIAASFARSDDSLVKLVMVGFLFVSTNLGLCLQAGKNACSPNSISSLADAVSTFFTLGVGELPMSCRGLGNAFRRSGTIGQKGGAILLGLGITVPVLLVIIPLLMQADAAFEGMLRYLPELSLPELFATAILGGCVAFVLYTRNTALQHQNAPQKAVIFRQSVSPLTINTVLIAVCLVYCAYLLSQLAYFIGGFAGILPENFTLAQYARRGFFEMAWLCAINLTVVVLSLSLCAKERSVPLSTRLLCLFIGIVTLFLVATASAKMILYIDSYGLTRLRMLTQVIMVFFTVATVIVCVWLFVPKLPYMKIILISALVIGAAVSWADVNTQVARYNVNAYLSGNTKTVDVAYLETLGDSAVPYIVQLVQEAPDSEVSEAADHIISNSYAYVPDGFRNWNYVNHAAANYLPPVPSSEGAEDAEAEGQTTSQIS